MIPKWTIVIFIVLAIVSLVALFARKTVCAELTIPAAPEAIWSVLTDPSSYPIWNPIFVSIEGEFREGAQIRIEMKSPEDRVAILKPKLTKVAESSSLRMLGGMPGVFTFDHEWSLEASPSGTRVTQREEFRGLGVLLFDVAWVEEAYRQANINLRDRVESR